VNEAESCCTAVNLGDDDVVVDALESELDGESDNGFNVSAPSCCCCSCTVSCGSLDVC